MPTSYTTSWDLTPGSRRGYLCHTSALHEQTARFANGFRACHPVRAEVASLAESATSATSATEKGERPRRAAIVLARDREPFTGPRPGVRSVAGGVAGSGCRRRAEVRQAACLT